ncbi:hypothetical protein HK102_004977 [Quaeritorhiza haematococci]|nr:hypothetical protein HK102_004977 [Quaeritorhiza haematococci]
MQVVVVGGGVIGSAAAYYLSKRGVKNITIVEREGIACAASGKAGGFLAYHWCSDNPALDQLARKSFKLHEELAKTFCGYKTPNEGQQQSDGGPSTPEQICGNREGAGVIEESGAGNTMDYGYRRVTTYSVVVMEEKSKQAPKSGSGSSSLSSTAVPKKEPKSSTATTRKTSSSSTPSWCEGAVSGRVIGTPETTAQCHPELFTKALVRASGATVVHGIAEGLKFQRIDSSRSSSRGSEGSRSSSNTDKVVGVRITEISPSCRCGNKRRKPDADFDDGDGKAAEDEDGNSDDQPLAKRCCRSKVLSADVVVIAMGPWSGFAATKWGLPLPEITGQKVQSVVVQPKESVPGDCLFVEYKSLSGDWLEPEVYPR